MTKLKNLPYHNERLYALVRAVKDAKGKKVTEMCYCLGRSASTVWASVIEQEFLGTGETKESLKKKGWVARPIIVAEVGE